MTDISGPKRKQPVLWTEPGFSLKRVKPVVQRQKTAILVASSYQPLGFIPKNQRDLLRFEPLMERAFASVVALEGRRLRHNTSIQALITNQAFISAMGDDYTDALKKFIITNTETISTAKQTSNQFDTKILKMRMGGGSLNQVHQRLKELITLHEELSEHIDGHTKWLSDVSKRLLKAKAELEFKLLGVDEAAKRYDPHLTSINRTLTKLHPVIEDALKALA